MHTHTHTPNTITLPLLSMWTWGVYFWNPGYLYTVHTLYIHFIEGGGGNIIRVSYRGEGKPSQAEVSPSQSNREVDSLVTGRERGAQNQVPTKQKILYETLLMYSNTHRIHTVVLKKSSDML